MENITFQLFFFTNLLSHIFSAIISAFAEGITKTGTSNANRSCIIALILSARTISLLSLIEKTTFPLSPNPPAFPQSDYCFNRLFIAGGYVRGFVTSMDKGEPKIRRRYSPFIKNVMKRDMHKAQDGCSTGTGRRRHLITKMPSTVWPCFMTRARYSPKT